MKVTRILIAVLLLLAVVVAPAAFAQESSDEVNSYVVLTTRSNFIPWNVERDIARTGAQVTRTYNQIGALVVETDDPQMLRRVRNVQSVVPNIAFTNGVPREEMAITIEEVAAMANPPASGNDDAFFDLQYGHNAVNAQEAWARGFRGQGVTVAVLDEGFDLDHPDIVDRIVGTYNAIPYDPTNTNGAADGCNTAVDPNCENVQYVLPDTFSHGMHVAGTILASDNGFGSIGVAPEADLLMVKVLSEVIGSGAFDWVLNGVIWAVDNGADIINMSLGSGPIARDQATELLAAVNRAMTYASNNNVLVVVSAGNDSFNGNDSNFVILPAGAINTVTVSSTGAIGWAVSPETDGIHPTGFDAPAYAYSNFGNNYIDIAAPGGHYIYPGSETCVVAGLARPCFVFDYIFSTGNGGWYWSVGTSMAAPHVAGVAALIKSEKPWLNDEGIWAEMRMRARQPLPDISYSAPFLGSNFNENEYYGNVGIVSTDYAQPSQYLSCGNEAATLYVAPSGHIASTDMNINGRLYNGTLRGGTAGDVIVGTDGPDTLIGLNGNDFICGLAGNDRIDGGDQDDYLRGGEGDDRMVGLNGMDTMYGEAGNDNMDGGDGTDYMDGGPGNDMMYGRNGNETMFGGQGEDMMRGEQGNDTMYGGPGDDYMHGGDNDDEMYGEDGNDTMIPGNGNDNVNQ